MYLTAALQTTFYGAMKFEKLSSLFLPAAQGLQSSCIITFVYLDSILFGYCNIVIFSYVCFRFTLFSLNFLASLSHFLFSHSFFYALFYRQVSFAYVSELVDWFVSGLYFDLYF